MYTTKYYTNQIIIRYIIITRRNLLISATKRMITVIIYWESTSHKSPAKLQVLWHEQLVTSGDSPLYGIIDIQHYKLLHSGEEIRDLSKNC